MQSLPCCISTTQGEKANGSRIDYGGKENLDALDFLRRLNEQVYARVSGCDDDR